MATRSAIEATRTKIKGEVGRKNDGNISAKKLIQRIVSAVRADAAFGDDCPLYRAMGYRPASERRSPKRAVAATAATEANTSAAPEAPVVAPK